MKVNYPNAILEKFPSPLWKNNSLHFALFENIFTQFLLNVTQLLVPGKLKKKKKKFKSRF